MWRSSLLIGSLIWAGAANAAVCLPPVFENGQRLHPLQDVSVNWLDPLFRQHEVCWRQPESADELRVFVVGNSGPFGFPLRVEYAFTGLLNRSLATKTPPAHVYNLGFVYTYQLKEALILQEARHYEPDWIVYGINLADFHHRVPLFYPEMVAFFRSNASALEELAERNPPGLEEPAGVYASRMRARGWRRGPITALRDFGLLTRIAARKHAGRLRERLFPAAGPLPYSPPAIAKHTARYKCEEVKEHFYRNFRGWREWQPFGHLEQIRRETGARILVVNWPATHEPRGECYNRRYPARVVETYRSWLREQVQAAGLDYLDLHDLLQPEEFFDSLHPRRTGHRRIAEAVEAELERLNPDW